MAGAKLIEPSAYGLTGVDGNWSTIPITIGQSSPQTFDLYVSTAANINYVVSAEACEYAKNQTSCASSHGNVFGVGYSSDFEPPGNATAPITLNMAVDSNLYGNIHCKYGSDYVGVGYNKYGLYSNTKELIGYYTSETYWYGMFGLLAKPFNLPAYNKNYPSFIESLKSEGFIGSLSWGYTAGAPYQLSGNGPQVSLTLGGYDQSRFVSNDAIFQMNFTEITRYLTVGLQSIKIETSKKNHQAISSPINMALDSTLPYIWLPEDACKVFEKAFNLNYDASENMYFIPKTIRDGFVNAQNQPNITFDLNTELDGSGDSVIINLPYPSVDLMLTPPLEKESRYYFPLKRAANESQYVLGRAFFQEAYVIADFERDNFRVSPCLFEENSVSQVQPIKSGTKNHIVPTKEPNSHPQQQSSGSGSSDAGLIAGVVVAVVVVIALVGVGLWWWRRKKRRDRQEDEKEPPHYSEHAAELEAEQTRRRDVKHKSELDATESGRGTPIAGFERESVTSDRFRSPLSSPLGRGSNPSPGMSEMDGTNYFELPVNSGSVRRKNRYTDEQAHELSTNRMSTAIDGSEEMQAAVTEPPILPQVQPTMLEETGTDDLTTNTEHTTKQASEEAGTKTDDVPSHS